MGLRHPLDDQDDEPTPENARGAGAAPARPDWLTDADAGARDEAARSGGDEDLPHPRLISSAPEKAEPGHPGKTEVTKRWEAAASSVPTLRLHQTPAGARAPVLPPEADDDPEAEADADAFLGDEETVAQRPNAAPARAFAPLDEPWWVVAADALRHDRRIQIAVGAALAALLAFLLWPRSSPNVSLSTIHRHPDRYDSQVVTVHGSVGDVFPMGSGYTFYLRQGRETLVVFTRSRVPVRGQNVVVKGTINTGYMDGAARQTLFEATP